MLNSDCGYLKELRKKYAAMLATNPSAFSNSKEVDIENIVGTIEGIVNSPVVPKNPSISSVSNDVSPPTQVPPQPLQQLAGTSTTDKENTGKAANGLKFGAP